MPPMFSVQCVCAFACIIPYLANDKSPLSVKFNSHILTCYFENNNLRNRSATACTVRTGWMRIKLSIECLRRTTMCSVAMADIVSDGGVSRTFSREIEHRFRFFFFLILNIIIITHRPAILRIKLQWMSRLPDYGQPMRQFIHEKS